MTVSSSTEPLALSLLDGVGVLLGIGATDKAPWQDVVDLGREGGGSVATQLSFFALVLLDQASLVGLGHVFAAFTSDFVDGPQNHLL